MAEPREFAMLPGADIVESGLRDLGNGEETLNSLLVATAAPRLMRVGVTLSAPWSPGTAKDRLFALLQNEYGDGAHRRYNALIERVISYARSRPFAKQ